MSKAHVWFDKGKEEGTKEGYNQALKDIEKEGIKDNSIKECPRIIISKSVLKSLIK